MRCSRPSRRKTSRLPSRKFRRLNSLKSFWVDTTLARSHLQLAPALHPPSRYCDALGIRGYCTEVGLREDPILGRENPPRASKPVALRLLERRCKRRSLGLGVDT